MPDPAFAMRDRNTIVRYCLFQLPGLIVVGTLLWIAAAYEALSPGTALILLTLWIAKDAVLYPLTWKAYEPHDAVGDDRFSGRKAVALTELNPEGKVRLGSEIWNARSADGSPIPKDHPVRISRTEGLRLIVTRCH